MIFGRNKDVDKKVKKESFMQGVLALMFSQVFIKLLGYVYRCYLTNRPGFGDSGNAIYSAGYNIYALLLTLSSVGVPNAISKLVSEKTTKGDERGVRRIFKVALATFSVIGLIGTLILLIGAKQISNNMGIPDAEMVLVVLSPALFFVAVCSVFRGYFNGQARIKVTANSQTLEQIFKTVFTIIAVELVVVYVGENTALMAAGATAATTLSVLMSFIYILVYFKIFKKGKATVGNQEKSDLDDKTVWQIVKSILWVSIPMSLSAILTTINRNIDSHTVVNLLENFLTEKEAIKQYGILSGKVEILTSLPLAFNVAFATALVPAITAAKVKNRMDDAVRRISFSLLTTVVIVLPCVVGMIVLADPILKLVFPNASEGAFILQVCVVATIFTAMEQTINGALQGLGRIFVPACALTIGVILKLILNYILVPLAPDVCVIGGAAGAAFATNVCHIVAFSISFAVLRKTINLKISLGKTFIKPLIASLIMSIAAYGTFVGLAHVLPNVVVKFASIRITGAILATIIALLVAGIVYVASILILNVFNKEDILMLPAGGKIYSILQKMGIYKEN